MIESIRIVTRAIFAVPAALGGVVLAAALGVLVAAFTALALAVAVVVQAGVWAATGKWGTS